MADDNSEQLCLSRQIGRLSHRFVCGGIIVRNNYNHCPRAGVCVGSRKSTPLANVML